MNELITYLTVSLGGLISQVAGAIIALIVGLFIIGRLNKLVKRILTSSSKIDPTLKPFLGSLTNVILKIVLIIGVIEVAGYRATSLVAILGAASLAIGLAFQGTLSNFAGGVLLLTLRPFQVGNVIEVGGNTGKVEAIHVFNTVLVTPDNKVISVPNSSVSSATITNFSVKDKRRVDFVFGVGYESDLRLVAKTIEDVVTSHPKVDKDPAPFIRLGNQGASSLDFTVRLWCNSADYWDVYFDVMEQVTDAFNAKGISIPFPQMDVHLDK